MSKNIKGVIPKWRFPEFRDNGGWEEKELNESLDYLQPTQYLVQSENYSDNYETPVLTAGKSFVLGCTNEKDGIFNNKLPVIIFDDFTTDSKFVDFPFKVKSSAIKILLAKYNFNIKFIFEIMQIVSYEVSVHKRHWISIFSKLKVLIPKLPEQQKIADCLSSIDDLISAEEKKLSLLNDYKKGWMQKLFPAEGKTVPEWRFPEFQDSEEWTQKKLDEIGKFIRGFSYSSQDTTDDKTKLLVIRSNNIVPMGKTDYINNLRYVNKKCSKEQNLIFGDITICMANGSSNLIGKSSFYDGGYAGDITVGAFCGIFRSPLPIVRYLFQTNQYNRELQRVSQGGDGAIANLKEIDIKNIEFLLPTLPEEQNGIAAFLSVIDELVYRQTDKIEALKQHKKALMQGLFPAVKEVL